MLPVIARFVGKVQELESGLETGVTRASPTTVTSMGGSFYLGWLVQGRRPYVIWVNEGLEGNGPSQRSSLSKIAAQMR